MKKQIEVIETAICETENTEDAQYLMTTHNELVRAMEK